MFTFSNSTLSQSYSIKPKKDSNNDYVNVSNDISNVDKNILTVDIKAINFDNISVELALNVLQLKHNIYYEMSQYDVIEYYNDKMKLTNNIDTILALKIILKFKLKGLDVKINKNNVMTFSDTNIQNNGQEQDTGLIDNNKSNHDKINKNHKYEYNHKQEQNNFKIQQIQNEPVFKLVQNNKIFGNADTLGLNQNQINQNQNNQNQVNNSSQNNQNQVNNSSQNNQNQVNNSSHNNQNQVNNSSQNNFKINQQALEIKNLDKIDKLKYNSKILEKQNYTQFQAYSNKNIQHQQAYNQPNLYNNTQPYSINNNNNNAKINSKPIETINGQTVVNSSEFDIDSIISSYTQKKSLGMIK